MPQENNNTVPSAGFNAKERIARMREEAAKSENKVNNHAIFALTAPNVMSWDVSTVQAKYTDSTTIQYDIYGKAGLIDSRRQKLETPVENWEDPKVQPTLEMIQAYFKDEPAVNPTKELFAPK